MRKLHRLAAVLYRAKAHRLLDAYWGPRRLTVLAYHRILDPAVPGFDGYEPNVSATPAMFERQMAFVARHFSVISLDQLRAHVADGQPLPPRPLLITFDDGYLDNYENALPVLRRYSLPAVIFLITRYMGQPVRPWWDECAYYFHHTTLAQADLPLIGSHPLGDRCRATRETLMRALKQVPEAEKQTALKALPAALKVDPPDDPPLFVSWDQVRDLVQQGVACQPHTVNHPILTRIPLDEARRELQESRAQIEAQTGQPADALAYPNGEPSDYNTAIFAALRDTGYSLAFTLIEALMRAGQIRQHPLEIPRLFLSHADTFEWFVMKVMGLTALRARHLI